MPTFNHMMLITHNHLLNPYYFLLRQELSKSSSICSFVRQVLTFLKHSIFIFLAQIHFKSSTQRAFREHLSIQKAFREHSESTKLRVTSFLSLLLMTIYFWVSCLFSLFFGWLSRCPKRARQSPLFWALHLDKIHQNKSSTIPLQSYRF